MRAATTPGWEFSGWTLTGPLTLTAGILDVSGTGGVLTAHFETIAYSVYFVTGGSVNAQANIGGQVLSAGQATGLPAGTYSLSAVLGTGATFLQWIPSSAIAIQNATNSSTNLTVAGYRYLYAIVDPFALDRSHRIPRADRPGICSELYGRDRGKFAVLDFMERTPHRMLEP